ncbi:riboflavin synthase [Paenibacillus cellulositrophicus]|uniref:riboflavin synthase n=1 Tax=Paenibacillus cellulositrophicus TaxID=562959 RepID=UPI00126711F8|nr:riboflavin synthase [Paenibacillus cellulositrophicus]
MFTGLVEEVGVMRGVSSKGETMILHIEASRIMGDLKIGDSVSVNGVCLTAVEIGARSFAVDVMPQTYRHSTLKSLGAGSRVNLERAMQVGARFGGHIVQGHADGTGTIRAMDRDQNAVLIEVEPEDTALLRYIIPQGSITLDGISLTVVKTSATTFTVSIIPHTLAETSLADKKPGSALNLECDILGKYVDHLLHYRTGEGNGRPEPSGISLELLAQHGFA